MQLHVMAKSITSLAMLQCMTAPGVFIKPKIPESLVASQMERSVSVSSRVSSDLNIRDITSGGGPLISVRPVQPKFAVTFLTNRFIAGVV